MGDTMAMRIEPTIMRDRPIVSLWRKFWSSRPALVRRLSDGHRTVIIVDRTTTVFGHSNIAVGGRVRTMKGSVVDAATGRIELAAGVVICRFAVLEAAGGRISVGNNTTIGDYSSIYGQGGLRIGRDVLIASGVRIVPSSHVFDRVDTPIREQGIVGAGVCIEDDVWVGTNVVILDGVTIGKGAVIGAGAIVTRSVPAYGIAVGTPARVVRLRTEA
jgi:acetyltransferase-like isoleucine patch superfamily enzyme